jgi:aspartyl/asparaginyl beta-hydroxylase (cupin superfamily)
VDSIEQIARAAGAAANAGRWEEAERLWNEALRINPRHPQALLSLGLHALMRRDFAGACQRLDAARAAAPQDPIICISLARARRELGDDAGESAAIEAALAIDAYFLPALLMKAARLERIGAGHNAAMYYRNAVKIAPPEPQWPESLRTQLQHAREVSNAHAVAFNAYLADKVRDLQASMPARMQGRWREAASIMAGATQPYHSVCNQLYAPRLPAIPFFEREMFPWAAALEAQTDAIRAELMTALAQDRDKFSPYVAMQPGQPVNQWADLNHSARWSAFHLWRRGEQVEENLGRCPKTAEALGVVEMAEIGGLCPNAMFSALAPKTQIPPHTGDTNARVVAHLPLIVPEGCVYRVGFEQTRWEVGKLLVFDDTIEHEARNDSEELRVVLIFDVWNPLLEPVERAMVQAMAAAARAYGGAR